MLPFGIARRTSSPVPSLSIWPRPFLVDILGRLLSILVVLSLRDLRWQPLVGGGVQGPQHTHAIAHLCQRRHHAPDLHKTSNQPLTRGILCDTWQCLTRMRAPTSASAATTRRTCTKRPIRVGHVAYGVTRGSVSRAYARPPPLATPPHVRNA
jgi:hypothetical protein